MTDHDSKLVDIEAMIENAWNKHICSEFEKTLSEAELVHFQEVFKIGFNAARDYYEKQINGWSEAQEKLMAEMRVMEEALEKMVNDKSPPWDDLDWKRLAREALNKNAPN